MPCWRVGRARGDERRHRPGFGDSFFQDLAVLGFLVVHQLVGIDRFVQLSRVGVDADLAEHAFHAKGPRFVRHDRHDVLADLLVVAQLAQQPDEAHRRRHRFVLAAVQELLDIRSSAARPSWDASAGGWARGRPVPRGVLAGTSFRRCLRRLVERGLGDVLVRDGNAKAAAEFAQLFFVGFFLLCVMLRPSPTSPSP